MNASPDTIIDVPAFGRCRPIDFFDAWRYAQAEVEVTFREWNAAPGGGARRSPRCVPCGAGPRGAGRRDAGDAHAAPVTF
jgi:hypothetical protein